MTDLTSVPWRADGCRLLAPVPGEDAVAVPVGDMNTAALADRMASLQTADLIRRKAEGPWTYEGGVQAALRVLGSQHFPRQVSAKTEKCRLFHDHDKPGAMDYGYSCYETVSICVGCGTDRCKVLPLVEALIPEAQREDEEA